MERIIRHLQITEMPVKIYHWNNLGDYQILAEFLRQTRGASRRTVFMDFTVGLFTFPSPV
jgi:hypothetical protein